MTISRRRFIGAILATAVMPSVVKASTPAPVSASSGALISAEEFFGSGRVIPIVPVEDAELFRQIGARMALVREMIAEGCLRHDLLN